MSDVEIDSVAGGRWIDVAIGLFVNAVYDGGKAAVEWYGKNKGGGADDTTWTNIGNSQMGA